MIEAVEMKDRSFVLAVQWHPESSLGDDSVLNELLDWEKKEEVLGWLDTL